MALLFGLNSLDISHRKFFHNIRSSVGVDGKISRQAHLKLILEMENVYGSKVID